MIYDFDVVWCPGNFSSYLENYADFIIDPFGNHPFKTRVEVSHCTWKKGYSVQKFDGKYWRFEKYVVANGTDTPILEPEELVTDSEESAGEAVIGQRKVGRRIEEYCVYFRDVKTKGTYKCDSSVMFLRVSDRKYSLKSLNDVLYNYFRNSKDNWKAVVFKYNATSLTYIRLFLHDKKFEKVSRL